MNSFSITGSADIRDIEENPYSSFMPHHSVYAGLSQAAAVYPDRRALTYISVPDPEADSQSWTYAAFMARLRQAANLFSQLAAGEPPRIAMLLPAMPQAYFTLFGGETAGTVCPINCLLDAAHVADLVRASGANIVVALGPNAELDIWSRVAGLPATCPQLRHLLAVGGAPGAIDFDAALDSMPGDTLVFERQVDADTLAALFHTGGTTGKPKLARHTHGNQLHAAWGAAQMVGTVASDVVLNGFPLFHVAGSLVYGLSTLLSGGELLLPTLTSLRNRPFVDRYWAFVAKHRVTVLAAVPTVIATLLTVPQAQADLSSVRILLTGGSPLPDALATAFEHQFGIGVRNILGMTECAGVIAIEPVQGPRVPGSCGLALPFTRVYTVGDDGEALPAGAAGVLCVTGPNVGPGYTEARHNAGTFTARGELVTGDIGRVDAAGRVFITGRAKDVIIRSSHNIDPQVIENALLRHPGVLAAAAVGAPDEHAGEVPVAFVVLKLGVVLTEEALSAFANPLIPERPAYPKAITFLDSLPMTAIGKIFKPELRCRAVQQVLADRLGAAGLAEQAGLEVAIASSQLTAVFKPAAGADREALAASLKPLMRGFALHYRIDH